MGNLTQKSSQSGETIEYEWDAAGRLLRVQSRDGNLDGYDWSAVYDPLGRRLRSKHQVVESDVPQSNDQQEIDSWYDPEVEFLEIAVRINGGSRIWKVYGPDLDGSFGSLQGTGGLQTTIKGSDGTTAAYLNNRFGDAVATLDGSGVSWNPTVFGGYGRVAGAAAGLFTETQPLSEAMGWRGRRINSTGLYYLGARYYDPEAGRFISAPPPGPRGQPEPLRLRRWRSGQWT